MECVPKFLDTLDSYFFALRIASVGYHRHTIQCVLIIAALSV